jgi:heterodisulfide reductase subunit C
MRLHLEQQPFRFRRACRKEVPIVKRPFDNTDASNGMMAQDRAELPPSAAPSPAPRTFASSWSPRVMYEATLDPTFADSIAALPGAEKIRACIQCGTCTGVCPMSPYMDYSPRRLIAMTRAGYRREVLGSFTIWLCSSCYACTVACPKGIKITDVMYALKRRAIKDGLYPRRFPIPVLAREFFGAVRKRGRSSEGRLLARLYLRTNPLRALPIAGLGLRLWRRGRMDFRAAHVRRRAELARLLAAPRGSRAQQAAS